MTTSQSPRGSHGARFVWAKSFPFDAEIEQWLPLWQHLDDSADVAGLIWDLWLADSVKRPIVDVVGESNARLLVQWLAGVHDVGKATPAFAVQVNRLADRMNREAGLRWSAMVLTDRAQLRHELAGAAIVDRWLAARSDLQPAARRRLTAVVAGHHGSFPAARVVAEAPDLEHLIGDEPWVLIQDELLDRCAERLGFDPRGEWLKAGLGRSSSMLITAIVIMADWISSDSELFPLINVDEVPGLSGSDQAPSVRALRGWERVSLGQPWSPPGEMVSPVQRFEERFGWPPRAMQSEVIQAAERMVAPGLLMLEAPMGQGKTEAAFMAAEVLARRSGSSGVYVALPTQATSNAMFSRLLTWLASLPATDGESTQTVNLAHGKAALNDELRSIARANDLSIYDRDGGPGASPSRYRPVVGEWMRGRKRATFSNFVVGTIDQVLFAALRARHVSLRQLGLAGKVIVIDEVHAADPFMSTYLERALEWLAASGSPVVLMSATLPAGQRSALYAAYEAGRSVRTGVQPAGESIVSLLSGDIGYPSVVTTGQSAPEITVVRDGGPRQNVRVKRLNDEPSELADLLRESLRDGGCAVVIRNTVRRAQETARLLQSVLTDAEVSVAHASFLAADRVRIDQELVRRFGPPGTAERPYRSVVVATQVVEQSLDIDFDLMVTDLAPVDLVLQRIGRLHRHQRQRPTRLSQATCYIAGVDWSHDPPKPDRGSVAVYERWPLLASLSVLNPALEGQAIELPADIPVLVQSAYANEVSLPDAWRDAGVGAQKAHREHLAQRQSSADAMRIAPVGKPGKDLYDFSRAAHGTVDEDDPRSQGYVRDGSDSIEVVAIQSESGVDLLPSWVETSVPPELPLRDHEVSWEQAKVLARCTLRLPFALSQPSIVDRVIYELEKVQFAGWQRSPFLSGQLALVLDGDRRATLAGHRLHYDLELGLEVERDET